jgi:single-stranded-DNA-specific exonuclease
VAIAPPQPTVEQKHAGPRLLLEPCSMQDAMRLERELGVSHPVAQVLVRRGLSDPGAARDFLDADESHPATAFREMGEAVALVARHIDEGGRITVHGDYDVDGVSSTALLVGALRTLGATADWFLPSRFDDGYGLSAATVDTLAQRGTGLLITVDCGITAIEEVAAARRAGMDVLVTDHHSPRADGVLPDAPLLHPVLSGYPCPHLCGTGVAYKLAVALHDAMGSPAEAAGGDPHLDLVALATVADVVPLVGENRRLVRQGLKALATTTRPGLRALLQVAGVDPSAVDERTVGFALGPRLNAAGRLGRADAGVELLLTQDQDRAAAIADELDAANRDRRHTETRIVFEAEAQVAEQGDAAAYVLAGEGWHPGVVGIVASRIAERRHRPTIVIALDGDSGVGSARSIPGFDLLAGLQPCASHLIRHGGHRAAAGLEIARDEIDSFRAAFTAHAAATLTADDLVPQVRVDAVVSGEEVGMALAEELQTLAPFGAGNPSVTLLVPAARISASTPMGEGKHVRFTVDSGTVRSRGVAFGNGGRLPVALDEPVDATFGLELSEYRGLVESRLVLRHVRSCEPGSLEVIGEPLDYMAAVWEEMDRPLEALPAAAPPPPPSGAQALLSEPPRRQVRDRRAVGPAGTIAGVVATGEDVLVVCADAPRRQRALSPRLGGFALVSYAALERNPDLAGAFPHLIALDPPAHAHQDEMLRCGSGFTHLAWGHAELRFAQQVHALEYGLRDSLSALYREVRDAGGAEGEALEQMLRGQGRHPRSPVLAGRLLRVLSELGLLRVQREVPKLGVPEAQRTALEQSAAFRVYDARHEEGIRFLTTATARAA